jgi:hypothetical protein
LFARRRPLKKLEFLGFLPAKAGHDEEPKRRIKSFGKVHVANWVPEEERRKLEEATRRMNEKYAGKGGDDGS